MNKMKIVIPMILLGLSASCGLSPVATPIIQLPSVSGGGGPMIIMAPANATPTPTPFMPSPPTPTYIPTRYPTPTFVPTSTPGVTEFVSKSWEDYPGPVVWPDVEIPAPVGVLPQPRDQVNILLLGSDQRPNEGGLRTDTIILLTLNPAENTANLTSFPRDLYVYIPGWTVQRINTAYGYGGFDLLGITMEYNFGVRPDYYVLINFWSFTDVIDSLGGVDVNAAVSLTDHRDGRGQYTVPAGVTHMDGETALWYVRSRYSTSDFDRGRRQQEVVQATFNKLLSLDGLSRAPQLYEIYRQNVTTDLTFDQIAPFIPLAAKLSDTSNIHHYFIGLQQVIPYVNSVGAQVLLPIRDAVLQVMNQALNVP